MPGVLIYCSYIWVLVYCLPGVTQKVLPIYRFLFMCLSVSCYRCHTKGPTNLQVLFMCLSVFRSRYHTKGPTNLQVLIYRF